MIPLKVIFIILLAHYTADFKLQTDWQAKNKSSNNKALLLHTSCYALVMFLGAVAMDLTFLQSLAFATITFVSHTATDYITSRRNKELWEAGKNHEFFDGVGLDQLSHYVQLFLTYYWIVNAK